MRRRPFRKFPSASSEAEFENFSIQFEEIVNMPFFFFDRLYLVFMLPGILLALWATAKTKSTFARYSQVAASSGVTGAEAAWRMLQAAGVRDVRIEPTQGMLSDHYDPTSKTLRLSEAVYASRSLAAIGVACHEAGHALQHAHGYALLGLRTLLVPAVNLGSTLYVWILFAGVLFHSQNLVLAGVILFSFTVLFAVVTLPVEWDASARAKRAMVAAGLVTIQEQKHAAAVLNAAFLTYIASALTAILTLLYYLMRFGAFGGSSDD